MRRSDAEGRLQLWSFGEKKIFRLSQPLAPDEYLVFSRESEENYKFHRDLSTCKFRDLDHDKFVLMMINYELAYHGDHMFSSNTRTLKTGGCTCGSWILKDNEFLHTEGCIKHRK